MQANDVVIRFYGTIRAVAGRHAMDSSERDDLAQDAVVRVLKCWGNFKGEATDSRVAAWVKGVTLNVWRDACEKSATRVYHLRRLWAGFDHGWITKGGRPRKGEAPRAKRVHKRKQAGNSVAIAV